MGAVASLFGGEAFSCLGWIAAGAGADAALELTGELVVELGCWDLPSLALLAIAKALFSTFLLEL